jgi:Arc/MetJ-type ribon-helix-helix transcriptional regulator
MRSVQTTTVRLPRQLYEQARRVVAKTGAAASLNDFMVEAVEDKLRQITEKEIDAAFAGMGQDEEYQREAVALARSFDQSDWEAFRVANAASRHERPRKKRSSSSASR